MYLVAGLHRGCTTLVANILSRQNQVLHFHEPFNLQGGISSRFLIDVLRNRKSLINLLNQFAWKFSPSNIKILLYKFLGPVELVKDPFMFTFLDNPYEIAKEFDKIIYVLREPNEWVQSNLRRGFTLAGSIETIEDSELEIFCNEFVSLKKFSDQDRLYKAYIMSVKRAQRCGAKFVLCNSSIENQLMQLNLGFKNKSKFYGLSVLRFGYMDSGSKFTETKTSINHPIIENSIKNEANTIYHEIKLNLTV